LYVKISGIINIAGSIFYKKDKQQIFKDNKSFLMFFVLAKWAKEA